MDWLTSALKTLRVWLDWLPNPVVALIILGLAVTAAPADVRATEWLPPDRCAAMVPSN